MPEWKIPLYKIYTDDEDLNLVTKIIRKFMVKKLIIDHNEKGEIVSPSYVDIVSKINEIIEILSIEKVDDKDLR